MTFATNSSPGVRRRRRAKAPTNRRRTAAKGLTLGLAAVAIGCVSVASVLAGAGWLLGRSFESRSDIRSALAVVRSSTRLAGAGTLAGSPAWSAVAAILPAPGHGVRPAVDPMRALALAAPMERPDDPDHTGSIPSSYKLASIDASPVVRARIPVRDSSTAMPLPRARPRLAALMIDPGLATRPDDNPRPPKTAIYDITGQTVYMPNGERLEAHSGLGEYMDSPRHVSLKNRGSTPPNTYELKLRESLFHGVQAIRLTPVADSEMFGRDGILAHSYLLGPNGQSNGCISFKDYQKFLEAFLRGEVERVIVVARLDNAPTPVAPTLAHRPVPTRSAEVVLSEPRTLRVW